MSAESRVPRLFWPIAALFVLAASVWLSATARGRWDYSLDAGPPIEALLHLRLHDFLSARPDMGPLSLVLRAPFVAFGQLFNDAHSHYTPVDYRYWASDYRWGILPCLLVAGAFGVALARFAAARGRGLLACTAIVVLSVVNPVSLRAIHFGHPEEILGAALLTGAMLAAIARRPWLAAALVALAVVNKQWAVIGLPAVVVVLVSSVGWERLRRPALVIFGLIALLFGPLLVADAGSLVDLTKRMADLRGTYVFPANIWYSLSPDLPPARAAVSGVGLHAIPDWLGLVARPLIVTMGVVVPLLLARRVREDVLNRALPLLALVMLLRCALDPADNGYYHVPFLLAVLAADAVSGRFYATAAACVFLQAPTTFKPSPEDLSLFYSLWAPAFAVYLAGRAYGLDWGELIRSRDPRASRRASQGRRREGVLHTARAEDAARDG